MITQRTGFLCAVGIFKNESHIMDEWVSHYLREGVDHLFLIDNGSTDDPYVTLTKHKDKVTVFYDAKRHSQSGLYQKYCFDLCKRFEWVLVCDLDEFIYSKNGFKTIAEYLKQLPDDVAQVCVPWKMFGSSGRNSLECPEDEKQPAEIVPNFTFRSNYDRRDGFQGVKYGKKGGRSNKRVKFSLNKSLVRTSALQRFRIHSHALYPNSGRTISSYLETTYPLGHRFKHNKAFSGINESIIAHSALNLNHYPIQSLEWFKKVKMTRGAADVPQAEHVRDLQYFQNYDQCSNDLEDLELAQKRKEAV